MQWDNKPDYFYAYEKHPRPASRSFTNQIVDGLSMNDAENRQLVSGNLENNPVIANPEFPVTFKRFS